MTVSIFLKYYTQFDHFLFTRFPDKITILEISFIPYMY